VFTDELPPAGPPLASAFALETGDGSMGVKVDQKAGSITVTCEPAMAPSGTVEITCGPNGSITIKAGVGGAITIDGGGTLALKAQQSVSIESKGTVEIKGTQIKLN
jgi:hypothetical protein